MLCIDLFCGLGGWSDGFLAEGYDCIGFDLERHDYGSGGYPGQLVLQDILTVHGSQFRDATCIVASPPCQKYSYMAMPWSRAKALIAWHRENSERAKALNALFDACFRIQYEACEAAGRYIPMVVENVKGAQPWVGRAKANYGSFYLWGDVDSIGGRIVQAGDVRWGAPSIKASRGVRTLPAEINEAIRQGHSPARWTNPAEHYFGPKAHNTESGHGQNPVNATKGFVTGLGRGHDWRQDPSSRFNSKSDSRKAASAQIAKIPFPLAQHIARIFKTPRTDER